MTSPKKQELEEAKEPKGGALAVIDYGEDAGAGMENVGAEEFRIPLLRILQGNSPQCDPTTPDRNVPGAKPGLILNTATGLMFPRAILVPVYRDHNYVEYIPRGAGGGFVGIHQPDEPLIESMRATQGRFGKLKRVNKDIAAETETVETYYLFGLVIPCDADWKPIDGAVEQDVVPFTSTQIAKYQSFMARYMSIEYPNAEGKKVRPPLWAHQWHLGTTPQRNKKGSFFGWTLAPASEPPVTCRMRLDDPLYAHGRAFYTLLKEGKAKADLAGDAARGGAATEAGEDREPGKEGDEIPF